MQKRPPYTVNRLLDAWNMITGWFLKSCSILQSSPTASGQGQGREYAKTSFPSLRIVDQRPHVSSQGAPCIDGYCQVNDNKPPCEQSAAYGAYQKGNQRPFLPKSHN